MSRSKFSDGFIPAGLCERCGKPVGTRGQHQYFIGLRFCIKKYLAQRKAAV